MSDVAVRRHVDGLDGIRALAAGLVLLYHYLDLAPMRLPEPLAVVGRGGWTGVDIFFAISGFILFLPFARAALTGADVDRRRFLRNRALRVLPAYWFNLFVLVVVLSPAFLFTADGWGKILSNATFTMGYLPPGDGFLVNKVAWTLCIEVGFYLLLPLVARFFVRERWLIAVPVTLVVTMTFKYLAIRYYGDPVDHAPVQTALATLFGTFDQFTAGMVAAAVWARCEHRGVRVPARAGAALAVAGFAGIYGVLLVLQHGLAPDSYWNGTGRFGWAPLLLAKPLLSTFAAVAVFGVCYTPNVTTRLFAWRPLAAVGVVSYGVYLWHLPVGQWMDRGLSGADVHAYRAPILFLSATALTLVVAAFSYRFVEQPFLLRKAPAAPSSIAVAEPVAAPPSTTVVLPEPRSVSSSRG